jgi:hypothetical protein
MNDGMARQLTSFAAGPVVLAPRVPHLVRLSAPPMFADEPPQEKSAECVILQEDHVAKLAPNWRASLAAPLRKPG